MLFGCFPHAATDCGPGSTAEKGVALLLVLWIITFLAVICAEFSWTMRNEVTTARNFRDGEQAYYTAEAGLNRAMIELMRTAGRPRRLQQTAVEEGMDELEEPLYWEPGSRYRFELDGNPCEVLIEDEGNKIEINTLLTKAEKDPTSLKAFLKKTLQLEGEELDIVADSLIDWHDKDNNVTGVNGAEDDFYKSLDPPVVCRNGDIPVLEELLLVRGIDEELYYGASRPEVQEQKTKLTREELNDILAGARQPEPEPVEQDDEDDAAPRGLGMADLFFAANPDLISMAGYQEKTSFKIDINTATQQQLQVLEGMNAATAQKIIALREDRRFAGATDPRLAGLQNYEVWKNQITVSGAKSRGLYKITATGYSPDKCVSRSLMCSAIIKKNMCLITTWKALN